MTIQQLSLPCQSSDQKLNHVWASVLIRRGKRFHRGIDVLVMHQLRTCIHASFILVITYSGSVPQSQSQARVAGAATYPSGMCESRACYLKPHLLTLPHVTHDLMFVDSADAAPRYVAAFSAVAGSCFVTAGSVAAFD